MRVYVEDGQLRPFSAVIETPRGPNTVAIRNIGQIEFPVAANVVADDVDQPSAEAIFSSTTIQGGALRTYPFDPTVDSVECLLKTDGRPLNARIELLQGPNNNKQVIELYTEDGCDRPFFCILETPGSGNVVRVVNTAPVEFPMTAGIVPHSINADMDDGRRPRRRRRHRRQLNAKQKEGGSLRRLPPFCDLLMIHEARVPHTHMLMRERER